MVFFEGVVLYLPVMAQLRLIATALLLLLVGGFVGELAHNLSVTHAWCGVHGEWSHVDSDSQAHTDFDAGLNSAAPKTGEHEHSDCWLAVHRRQWQNVQTGLTVILTAVTEPAALTVISEAEFPNREPVYRIAPKNSPPSV